MSSPSISLGPDEFAQGATKYIDIYPGDRDNRIVVHAKFGLTVPTWAIVDTGAPWCILSPEDSEGLDDVYRTKYTELKDFKIRGDSCNGWLYRMPISLEAEEGTGITVEATVFIPELAPHQVWEDIPNFLGLGGFLERIRFAVDPEHNLFYFGAL